MPSLTRTHPADVLVTIAALQDQVDDLVAIVEAQQRQIDELTAALADRDTGHRP